MLLAAHGLGCTASALLPQPIRVVTDGILRRIAARAFRGTQNACVTLLLAGLCSQGENNGGSGFSALVGKKMVPIKDIVEPQNPRDIQPIADVLATADDTLRDPQQAPPPKKFSLTASRIFPYIY